MLSYLSSAASTWDPEGWDAVSVLQLQNPLTKKWSCPTLTKRNRRCENVVSQERSIRVTTMINEMSIEDASVIVRDQNRELTALAETMLCPTHSRAHDSREKVKGVVAQWKNYMKASMRMQGQARPLARGAQVPSVEYQPSNASSADIQGRGFNVPPARTTTAPEVQIRPWTLAFDTSPVPPSPPPNYGATIDRDALETFMSAFESLTLQNQKLREQNQKLRDDNARLTDKEKAVATEHRRTKGVLEAVEEERDVLTDQVDELFREINSLRSREDRHLEKISALEDTVQKTSRTYRNLKKVWTAASVVPKREV